MAEMWRRLEWSRILPLGRQREEPEKSDSTLRIIELAERAGEPFVRVPDDRPRSLAGKDAADRVAALVLLVLLLPLIVAVAAAIRLSSSGPVIYRQVRIGMNRRLSGPKAKKASVYYDVYDRRTLDLPGKPFIIYKFRTMVDRAEADVGPIWARRDDPRVTVLGRLLRRLRLDELPQLYNVLRGDMSIVGPRPERPTFVRDLIRELPEYALRLRVRPGITGLAQVNQAYDTCLSDVREKVRYDIEYVRTMSVRSDLKILWRTVGVVLSMKGH
ncbi:MAG: sugar transferase [Candidatus Eisenbacteria bacterium]|nr:sugar transferase [Candidatus Eisenbacteria bacterium]